MNYGTLETELATRLNTYFAANSIDDKFEAIEIPQNEAEQARPFQKSKVTVQYLSSSYQPTESAGHVVQAEMVTIRLTFEVRSLRKEDGFYNLIQHVKKSLLGYKPASCTKKLVIDKYDMDFYENNTVSPYFDFKTEAINQEVLPEEDEPGFKNLTIERQCQ